MGENTRVIARELAIMLDISRDTLRRWIKKGKLPQPYRDKLGYFYWEKESIDKFIKEGGGK